MESVVEDEDQNHPYKVDWKRKATNDSLLGCQRRWIEDEVISAISVGC